jgi:translocation and assembly module TamB
MSESESKPSVPTASSGLVSRPKQRRPSRLRRFFLRHVPLALGGALILLATTLAGLYFWASSPGFENMVRRRLVETLETATGGRIEVGSFHWNLLRMEAEADGLVIHGLEASGEAPYAQAGRLRVRMSVLGFWSPRVLLRDLEIYQPQLHLIVYPGGSTNQPQPQRRKKSGESAIDQFFDLKTGHIEVEEGLLRYENRAAAFDFQDRFIPLNFNANDASLRMIYMPAAKERAESYRIEAGVRDFDLTRGASSKTPPVEGFMQATLDLTRSTADLRFLRITARSRGIKDRSLEISGSLSNFTHPRWQARATGELDMRLLNPITGYPCAPEGIARLNLTGAGQGARFRADGSIHVEDGAYIGTGVVATGVRLDARVHADSAQLLVTSIIARLREGGEIHGDLSLMPWLPVAPEAGAQQKAGANKNGHSTTVQSSSNEITIPVNGKVTAQFKGVALDTLLEMVSRQPFQHLGFDTLLNGLATALWSNGDVRTLSVETLMNLIPRAKASQGKTPAGGLLDATYTQRDGAVEVRKLLLRTPASQLEAHSHLGAYPMNSPTALAIDFHSQNLGEFDTVLRDLGLKRHGKSGTAALPVSLNGQAEFHGSWSGSLVDPRIAGTAKATQLTVELAAKSNSGTSHPQPLRLDAAEATGSYSAALIELSRGLLRRGNAELILSGSLAAGSSARGSVSKPSFDTNSMVHLRLHAARLNVDDLRPYIGRNLPVTGAFDAQLQVDGPLHAPNGSGWAEMENGRVYGEPFERIRAQGAVANKTLRLTSVTVSKASGKIAATGSYEFPSRHFQLDARGSGIDLARIEWLRHQGMAVTGRLEFTLAGSGTPGDPRLETHATLPGLTLSGEPLGKFELRAHTANRIVTYNLTSRLESTEITAQGQTAFSGDHATQARLDFSRFDIGPLFRMAHMPGLNAESALAGTATIDGPLARPEQLRGDIRLQPLAMTISGVHLRSEGKVHATLGNGMIRLDPLHVTGEETDLRAQGSLSIQNKYQLDLATSGTVNLKLAETLDPDLTASGNTSFQVEAHGPLMNPGLRGRIDFQNASLALEDMPNSLSQLRGTLEFNQNRLEVKSLTAMSGGGVLSVGGYLAYQHGLYADLTATGKGVRLRYPQGVSSLADASLHLQGPRNNMLLSGDVLVTRFTISPDLDITSLAAQTSAVKTITPPGAPSNHIRLNVHIGSSPQLSFQNAYAKLAGNIDLQLRGTVATPSLLGRVSITEGSGIIAGTRYDLQHGDIYFTNPVRIQPNIDLSASARVEDYDITLGVHGTPEKLAINYRSDPPLPEADVVALLALGRTASQQRLYMQQQQALVNSSTDALLGGALNATVSSRVQKLFGAGSVKVDPNYLGTLGNSTSRVIVEEQLGRALTLTYATNVNTTSQQLIQAEVAINHHVSLQLARDESGVFSMVLKTTRRYR